MESPTTSTHELTARALLLAPLLPIACAPGSVPRSVTALPCQTAALTVGGRVVPDPVIAEYPTWTSEKLASTIFTVGTPPSEGRKLAGSFRGNCQPSPAPG